MMTGRRASWQVFLARALSAFARESRN